MPHQSRSLSDAEIIRLHSVLFEEGQSTTTAAAEFGVSAVTMRRWRRNLLVFGEISSPRSVVQGRPRLLTRAQAEDLLMYLDERPTAYLDDMAYYLFDRHDVEISAPSLCRLLAEMRYSHKVAKKIAAQRNAELRAHWRAKSLYWRPSQLVFIDESAAAPRTGDRKRGWSPIGLPVLDTQRLRRDKRWSVLPALTLEGYFEDPLIIEGAITMDLFEEWFEEKVLPQLQPGHIVVMDNASIHSSDLVKELCVNAGIQLEFLPPYSPDYNPIEQSFNTLKLWVKRHIRMACLFVDFGAFMAYAVSEFMEVDAAGYFEDCGYFE